MAWTLEHLNAVDSAIARGVRVVVFGDKSITYHSLSDLLQIRALIASSLSPSSSSLRFAVADFSDSSATGSFDANS